MRVAMVETGGWGGIAHYVWNLADALGVEGADVRLLTNARYELQARASRFRVEGCFDGTAGYLRMARGLLRRLSRLAPDVVHVQSLLSTRFDALLWPLVRRRARLVVTAHNVRMHEPARWESWTLWRTLRAADAVIVHTADSAQAARARLRPGHRVEVIHHGDYAFFGLPAAGGSAAARRALGLPGGGPLLLAFGAIRPYKGLRELIAALPLVRARRPDAHLVIVGPLLTGSEIEYRDAIAAAGGDEAVTFRPVYVPHHEVAAYFQAADVAVYNYRDVTDSGSLRIACSLGTPVVATAVGGFREFLADGVTARLVPPADPAALAAAIGEVLADPARAAAMAAAARALAASQWSWTDSARATLALYHAMAEPGGPRRG